MNDQAARLKAGIRFLETQGWSPRRAVQAVEDFLAAPTEERRIEAERILDSTLTEFRRSAERRAMFPPGWARVRTSVDSGAGRD
jgi:hypothetical protein